MGIRDDIQTDLAAELDDPDGLGDISRSFEYEHPITQVRTIGRGWRAKQMLHESDGESEQVYDITFKCLANELATTPELDGILHIDGDEYVIKLLKPTASDTTWTMYGMG